MNYKKSIFLIVLVIIIIPFLMDWLIIGNNFPSNINNSDWVGFFGGYLGAIIGGLISLVGIMITIKYTDEQNKKDRELQVRPYCTIRYIGNVKDVVTNKIIAEYPIFFEPVENEGPKYVGVIYIKNIGLGPALEFDFEIDKIQCNRKRAPVIMQRNSEILANFVNVLQPNEEGAFIICVTFNFDKIPQKEIEIITTGKNKCYTVNQDIQNKYKSFDIVIHMKYHDLFNNTYYQKIVLKTSINVTIHTIEMQAEYMGDIYLEEVTDPSKL